jgi:hypothetical protein
VGLLCTSSACKLKNEVLYYRLPISTYVSIRRGTIVIRNVFPLHIHEIIASLKTEPFMNFQNIQNQFLGITFGFSLQKVASPNSSQGKTNKFI